MMSETIQKPENDKNTYRYVTLRNQIGCLLSYNSNANKSTFSICVNVGKTSDPVSKAGIAHFIEHLLFLGCNKYPKSDEFDHFLSANCGTSNAYTQDFYTTYYFTLDSRALSEGLERSCQYFISPLFSQEVIDKELAAFNDEFKEGMNNDESRINHLLCMNSNPKSNFNRFAGNKDTIQCSELRNIITEFFSQKYSANIIRIAMYSNLSIEEQITILNTTYANIPNKNISPYNIISPPPYEPPYCSRIFRVVPYMKVKRIRVNWYLPSFSSDPTKSFFYILELLGHEGPNSLLSYLKKEGLATAIISSIHEMGKAQTIIYLRIDLTEKGINNYIDVIDSMYMYINQIKIEGYKQYIADEITQIGKLKYMYKSSTNIDQIIIAYSSLLHTVSPTDINTYQHPTLLLDQNLIKMSLQKISPENMDIIVVGKKFAKEVKLVEPYMQIKYAIDEIPDYLLNKWNKIKPQNEKLTYPPPNIYIPTSFPICTSENSSDPRLILRNKNSECFYREECNFRTPFTRMSVIIKTKEICDAPSPLGVGFLYVWQHFIREYISEETYMAKLVGNSFKFSFGKKKGLKFVNFLGLYVTGYSTSLPSLMTSIMTKIKNCPYEDLEALFEQSLFSVKNTLRNIEYRSPIIQSFLVLKQLLKANEFSPTQIYTSLQSLKFNKFIEYSHLLLKQVFTSWLVISSLPEKDITAIIGNFNNILAATPLTLHQVIPYGVAKIPASHQYVFHKILPAEEETSALLHYVQSPIEYSCTLLYLAIQYIKDDYYIQLRMKQQAGYTVIVETMQNDYVYSLAFMIRSSSILPERMMACNIEFFDFILAKVNSMKAEEYANLVKATTMHFNQQETNLKAIFYKYYSMICINQYSFSKYNTIREQLPNTTYTQFKNYVNDLLGNSCRQICIQLLCEDNKAANEHAITEVKDSVNRHEWKRISIASEREIAMSCESHQDLASMKFVESNML